MSTRLVRHATLELAKKNLVDPLTSVFALDVNDKGAKNFIIMKYQQIFLSIIKSKAPVIYERIDLTDRVRLHIDIDIKYDAVPKKYKKDPLVYLEEQENEIIRCVNGLLHAKYNIKSKTAPIIILHSEGHDVYKKLSSHIIYPSVVFRTILDLKLFMLQLNGESFIKYADMSIYRPGFFRMPYCNKYGRTNKLIPTRGINYNISTSQQLILKDSIVKLDYMNNFSYTIQVVDIKEQIINNIIVVKDKPITLRKHSISINYNVPTPDIMLYLNLLGEHRWSTYTYWIQVGMALYNSNKDGFSIWDEWSKKYANYNKHECIYKWNTFTHSNYSIGTIKLFAKEDNKAQYDIVCKQIDVELFKNNKQTINRRYLIDRQKDIDVNSDDIIASSVAKWYTNNNQRVLSIKSAYGTGKTELITRIIDKYSPKRILFITHRQTLTHDLYGKLKKYDFISYMSKNHKVNSHTDRVICQIESLSKLVDMEFWYDDEEYPKYNLIIMDEVTSLLNHYSSPTVTDKLITFQRMLNLIGEAKVLALDGDFDNRAYSYLKDLDSNIQVIENIYSAQDKIFHFYQSSNEFDKIMIEKLKQKKKIVIATMASEDANKYTQILQQYDNTLKIITHTGKTDEKLKKYLKNVNDFWNKYDVVIYSPTIESGLDFNIEYFDNFFGILSSGSTSQRCFLQMCARIRKLTDLNIHISLKGLPYIENPELFTFNEAKQYIMNQIGYDYKFDKNHKKSYILLLTKYYTMMAYNKLEEMNKSPLLFVGYLCQLIQNKGFQVIYHKKPEDKLDAQFDKEIIIERKSQLLETDNITYMQADKLIDKQKDHTATAKDKLKLERYIMMTNFGVKTLNKDMLDKWYKKDYVFANLLDLIDVSNIKNDEGKNDKRNKCKMITEVITTLGYANIFDTKKIKKEDFDKNFMEAMKKCELFKKLDYSLPLFGKTKNMKKIKLIKTTALFKNFMNSILKDYGLELDINETTNSIKGKKFHTKYVCLNQLDNITDFIYFCLNQNKQIYNSKKINIPYNNYWNALNDSLKNKQFDIIYVDEEDNKAVMMLRLINNNGNEEEDELEVLLD